MRRLLLFITISLFTTLAASAQTDPVVTSIEPSSGPTSGGTEVTIRGANLATTVLCIIPCPPAVAFGDVVTFAKEEHADHLVVVTPAHVAGTVDVRVTPTGAKTAVVPNGFTFVAGIEDQYEKILLPVYTDGKVDGASGSQWQTDFWLRNSGETVATLAPWPCPPDLVCPPVYPLTMSLAPGRSLHNLPPFFQPQSSNPSRLLYVLRTPAATLDASLRVGDVARSSLNAGTEIPVVREPELLTAATELLNVPYDPSRFRLLLRVYDVTYPSAKFRVTLYPQSEDAQPIEHEVELVASTRQTSEFRTEAAYAQYDFEPLSHVDKVWPSAFRIRIEPLNAGSRYWAFVSITNNETQLVTTVTPQ